MIDNREHDHVHYVTELRETSVKFKKKKTGQLRDITFRNGCLEIPQLLINGNIMTVFSNFIALEQYDIDSKNYITSYIKFMDGLINTSEDVKYLHCCGIIEHSLGSDNEVADLINRLCKGVVFVPADSYLSNLTDEVNGYCSQKWHVWRAALKHNYFNNQWDKVSVCAAIYLLLLTNAQTIYAILAYHKPPHSE